MSFLKAGEIPNVVRFSEVTTIFDIDIGIQWGRDKRCAVGQRCRGSSSCTDVAAVSAGYSDNSCFEPMQLIIAIPF